MANHEIKEGLLTEADLAAYGIPAGKPGSCGALTSAQKCDPEVLPPGIEEDLSIIGTVL
jgi:hypothetical protein